MSLSAIDNPGGKDQGGHKARFGDIYGRKMEGGSIPNRDIINMDGMGASWRLLEMGLAQKLLDADKLSILRLLTFRLEDMGKSVRNNTRALMDITEENIILSKENPSLISRPPKKPKLVPHEEIEKFPTYYDGLSEDHPHYKLAKQESGFRQYETDMYDFEQEIKIAIIAALDKYQNVPKEVKDRLHLKDLEGYVLAHSLGTAFNAVKIAKAINESGEATINIPELIKAAVWHDIGKTQKVNERLVRANRELNKNEFGCVKVHPVQAYLALEELRKMGLITFDNASEIALTHHVKPDGTGYPKYHPKTNWAISYNDVPIEGRILAMSDSIDAMSFLRGHKIRAKNSDEIADELLDCTGTQFDPKCVITYLNSLTNISRNSDAIDLFDIEKRRLSVSNNMDSEDHADETEMFSQ